MLRSLIISAVLCSAAFASVADNYYPVSYSCNGSDTTFTFPWRINTTADIVVTLVDASAEPNTLALTTDYTVSATNNDFSSGGTVTTVSTYASGYTIVLSRTMALTQSTAWLNQGSLTPYSVRVAMDKMTMLIQNLQEQIERSLRFPIEDYGHDANVPSATERANRYPVFDANGFWTYVGWVPNSPTFGSTVLITTGGAEIPLTIQANNDPPSDTNNPFIRTGGGSSLSVNSGVWTESGSYGQLYLNGDQNSPVILGSGADITRRGWLGYGTLDPCYPVDIRGTVMDYNHISKYRPVYNVMAWGAKIDGVTDDHDAIQVCIDAAPAGSIILVPQGQCICNGELSFDGKENIIFEGTGGASAGIVYSEIAIQAQARSLINLAGANRITIRDIRLLANNPAGDPNCVLLLGRTGAASFGEHRFSNLTIYGYCDQALIYSIASEVNHWDHCTFDCYGGGANYTFYTSGADDLALGGLTSGSNLSGWVDHSYFSNTAADANSDAVVFVGVTGDWLFEQMLMSYSDGSGFLFQGPDAAGPSTFVKLQDIRAETSEGADCFIDVNRTGGSGEYAIGSLIVTNCTMTHPGSLDAWFLLGRDNTKLSTCKIDHCSSQAAASRISVYNADYSTFLMTEGIDLTVRNAAYGCVFEEGANHVLDIALDYGKNTITWIGTLAGAARNTNRLVFDTDGNGNSPGDVNAAGGFISKNGSTSAGYVDLYEDSDDGTNKVRLSTGALPGDQTWTWVGLYTGTFDPNNLAADANDIGTIAATGAALGDFVHPAAPYDLQGITATAYVSATNVIKIKLHNTTTGAINLASGTWRVKVER